MALRQDFSLFTRSNYRITVTVRDVDGNLIDLTGAEIRWVLKAPGGAAVWISKSTPPGEGIEILDQVMDKGKFRVSIVPANTERFPSAVAKHEAVLVLAGSRATVMYGEVTVQKSEV